MRNILTRSALLHNSLHHLDRAMGVYASSSSSSTSLSRISWATSCVFQSRQLHTSAQRRDTPPRSESPPLSSSGPSNSAKDPEHPYLWYHPSPSTRRIALSFLPQSPIPGARTVLGYLPMVQSSGLNDFQENPEFLKLLHVLIREGLEAKVAQELEFEASTRPTDGYLNLCDERALPPAGRIAEPEDTLGTVFVQSGQVDAETYQPMPSYRLVTANGPLILPKGLDNYIRGRLDKIDGEEKA